MGRPIIAGEVLTVQGVSLHLSTPLPPPPHVVFWEAEVWGVRCEVWGVRCEVSVCVIDMMCPHLYRERERGREGVHPSTSSLPPSLPPPPRHCFLWPGRRWRHLFSLTAGAFSRLLLSAWLWLGSLPGRSEYRKFYFSGNFVLSASVVGGEMWQWFLPLCQCVSWEGAAVYIYATAFFLPPSLLPPQAAPLRWLLQSLSQPAVSSGSESDSDSGSDSGSESPESSRRHGQTAG